MDNLNDLFFSPLGREYCVYFKYIMYLSFFMLVLTVFNIISRVLNAGKKKVRYDLYLVSIAHATLIYFINRLMYSICVK